MIFMDVDGLAEQEFDKAMRRERLKDAALLVLNVAVAALWLTLALTT